MAIVTLGVVALGSLRLFVSKGSGFKECHSWLSLKMKYASLHRLDRLVQRLSANRWLDDCSFAVCQV